MRLQALDEELEVVPPLGEEDGADDADLLLRNPEELRELGHPLVEQRLSVNEHQGRGRSLRDEVGGEYGLARPRRRHHDSDVVGKDRRRGATLDVEQLALEAEGCLPSSDPLVEESRLGAPLAEELERVPVAAAREAQERALLRGAGDDARRPLRGKPHRLLLVEVRVLKGGEAP
ncbi:MAG: hypothetical protein WCC48_13165 [Anaeromyxobacteraceae bacterium]